jgi:hypothetical protein
MMTNIILLVVWLHMAVDQNPTFQVLGVADNMKDCTAVKEKIEKVAKEGKPQLACMQILTPLKDASSQI